MTPAYDLSDNEQIQFPDYTQCITSILFTHPLMEDSVIICPYCALTPMIEVLYHVKHHQGSHDHYSNGYGQKHGTENIYGKQSNG